MHMPVWHFLFYETLLLENELGQKKLLFKLPNEYNVSEYLALPKLVVASFLNTFSHTNLAFNSEPSKVKVKEKVSKWIHV